MQVLDPASQVAAEMALDAGARAPTHLVHPFVDGRCHRAHRAQVDWIAVRIENGIAHVIDGGREREAGPAQRAEGPDVAKREPTGHETLQTFRENVIQS